MKESASRTRSASPILHSPFCASWACSSDGNRLANAMTYISSRNSAFRGIRGLRRRGKVRRTNGTRFAQTTRYFTSDRPASTFHRLQPTQTGEYRKILLMLTCKSHCSLLWECYHPFLLACPHITSSAASWLLLCTSRLRQEANDKMD